MIVQLHYVCTKVWNGHVSSSTMGTFILPSEAVDDFFETLHANQSYDVCETIAIVYRRVNV